MTDNQDQAPKKPARPNLFDPPAATRVLDERISVLASLDANPPPKKKKKRGLARSTIALLGFVGVLVTGAIYFDLSQPENDMGVISSPAGSVHQPVPESANSPAAVAASSEAPGVSLRELAASPSPATPQQSAPSTAVIENVATHDPIAILEQSSTHAAPAHQTDSSLLKALNAPAPTRQSAGNAPSRAEKKSDEASKHASRTLAATTHATSSQTTSVDSDVVLLEGLLASSNRQEARDRAAKKVKEPAKTGDAKSQEKIEP